MAAARGMLDEEHECMISQDHHDHNTYVLGQIHNHNVAIACLPAGIDGTSAAATVATNMLRTFPKLRFGLLVGIGGGIPNLESGVDIRLGDVVVSRPDNAHGGVLQYDKGKALECGQFELKGHLNKPPSALLTALVLLQAQNEVYGSRIPMYMRQMMTKHPRMRANGYSFPGVERDCLFCAHHVISSMESCDRCRNGRVIRDRRQNTKPRVHYGIIASGSQVVKDVRVRDRLGREFKAKCVEMEAAGIMDDFPCLVIRGVCDYADAHKNDVWHKYAATSAAAFAKELMSTMPLSEVHTISQPRVVNELSGSTLLHAIHVGMTAVASITGMLNFWTLSSLDLGQLHKDRCTSKTVPADQIALPDANHAGRDSKTRKGTEACSLEENKTSRKRISLYSSRESQLSEEARVLSITPRESFNLFAPICPRSRQVAPCDSRIGKEMETVGAGTRSEKNTCRYENSQPSTKEPQPAEEVCVSSITPRELFNFSMPTCPRPTLVAGHAEPLIQKLSEPIRNTNIGNDKHRWKKANAWRCCLCENKQSSSMLRTCENKLANSLAIITCCPICEHLRCKECKFLYIQEKGQKV